MDKLKQIITRLRTHSDWIGSVPAHRLCDQLLDEIKRIESEATPSRLHLDGMPTFYITADGRTCTHRMSEDDVPVWVKGFDNAMAAMARIDKNIERKAKHGDRTELMPPRKFVDLRDIPAGGSDHAD